MGDRGRRGSDNGGKENKVDNSRDSEEGECEREESGGEEQGAMGRRD